MDSTHEPGSVTPPACEGKHRHSPDEDKSKEQLLAELETLRAELETLRAAQSDRPCPEKCGRTADAIAGQVIEFTPAAREHLDHTNSQVHVLNLITERQRAYGHLRRQFDFTRAITDSLGEGVCAVDHEGRITFMNPAARQMLGWSGGELLGKSMHEKVHFQHASGTPYPDGECPLRLVLETGETMRSEDDIFTRKDGTIFPVSYVGSPIITDGRIIGSVVLFQDITDRRRLEDELRDSEQRFRAIFEQADIGMSLIGLDKRFLLVNQRLADITGYSAHELCRLTYSQITHPDDRPADARFDEVLLSGQIHGASLEKRYIRKDGMPTWVNLTASVVRNAAGEPAYFISVIEDISERKRLEEELRRSEREAATHARELEATFEAMADAVVTYDEEGRILRANSAALDLLSSDAEAVSKVLSAPIRERLAPSSMRDEHGQPMPPADWPQLRMLRGEVLTGPSAVDIAFRTLDGRDLRLNVSGAPMRDDDGRIAGAVAVLRDVTERHRLEQHAREAARADAERASELETIIEAIADGIIVFDHEGRAVRMNRAYRALLATDADPHYYEQPVHLRGHAVHVRDEHGTPLPPDQWPTNRALRGEALIGANAVDIIMRALDGRDVQVHMTGAPILDADGRVTGCVMVLRDVAERRQLQHEVATHASQLEAVFEAMADSISIFDRDGRLLHANAAARHLFNLDSNPAGLCPKELARHVDMRDESGQALPFERWPLGRVFGGEVLTGNNAMDVLLQGCDGHEYQLNVSGAPVLDTNGQIAGVVLVCRDVTERRQLEREVAARAGELEAIFTAMLDGVLVYGRDGTLRWANDAVRKHFALEARPDYCSLPLHERIALHDLRDEHGNPLDQTQWPQMRILAGESLHGLTAPDINLRALDGREIHASISGAPIRDEQGMINGAVIIFHDVTERHRLERRTQDALNALLQMAEALVLPPTDSDDSDDGDDHDLVATQAVAQRLVTLTRSVLGCQHTGIATFDPATRMLRPLAAAGLTREHEQRWWARTQGAHLSDFFSPEEVERLLAGEIIQRPLVAPGAGATPGSAGRRLTVAPMRIGDECVGILGTEHHDVTEREGAPPRLALLQAIARIAALAVERERLLREREAARSSELALREANRRMDEFLSIGSHELKTPVAVMQLSHHILGIHLKNAISSPGRHVHELRSALKVLKRADRQVARLGRLVGDLLDVSRIQINSLELRTAPCDLAAIVRMVTREQRQAHRMRVITLQLPDENTAPIRADADRIAQVVTNYLTNAIKYSPEDQPIDVILRLDGQQARVLVRDRGPGLAPAEQECIWERFQRVSVVAVQSGSEVGLGLGLYIGRTIIEQHHGQVGVDSVPGQGSTFWFTLPLAVDA